MPLPDSSYPELAAISIALIAAAFDLRTGKIPNCLTLPILAAAPLVQSFLAGPAALGPSLLGALICGAVPLLLFMRGAMGGGDVKLFAALGALLGVETGLRIELSSLFIALLVGFTILVWRGTLIATLLRSLRVLTSFGTVHTLGDADQPTEVRLGSPIAIATITTLWWTQLTSGLGP